MDLLKSAYDASLPLIQVQTDDLVNAVDVIRHILKTNPSKIPGHSAESFAKSGQKLFYEVEADAPEGAFAKLYELLVSTQRRCILINPKRSHPLFFNAGTLPVPKDLLLDHVRAVVDNEDKVQSIALRLGGTNLKNTAELTRLTMVNTGALTPQGVAHTRRELFRGSTGLLPINTEQALYEPSPELKSWVEREKDYFLFAKDFRLRPRGVLFGGPPGTGKSSGAKYIAESWGVPLYMLSLAGMKTKWHGESQTNLNAAFSTLDREEPCVVLMDEMEKYYGGHGDSSTSTEMLSQMLWWLAEHTSRVFVVMTTNNIDVLPPELYRPGRIDTVMIIDKISLAAAVELIAHDLPTFIKDKKQLEATIDHCQAAFKNHWVEQTMSSVAPAYVVEYVKSFLKGMKFGL